MEQFQAEHKATIGDKYKIGKGGYPDNGSGYYAQKLTYAKWLDFNNWQRVQMNHVETLPLVGMIMLIMGLYWPVLTLCFGIVIFICRAGYTFMYVRSGPEFRALFGTPMNIFRMLMLVGMVVQLAVDFIRG
eukprot:CAMPEP_0170493612 /NCGR_PEP_ID=MMETSP0208-20121228/14176_1 /TAXON_ID=197538 /ORGANISM="Strombidium inclinatum, Strain S3" /LENGTH=130 /DNA_ID=CAMNT_0010769563 /DNA_START=89 /DNA_END=477 /DNA_ORIENTATION=-